MALLIIYILHLVLTDAGKAYTGNTDQWNLCGQSCRWRVALAFWGNEYTGILNQTKYETGKFILVKLKDGFFFW